MTSGNCQDLTDLSRACQLLAKEEKDLLAVFLCGSRARGDHREDSDYDIMIVTDSDDVDTYDFMRRCEKHLATASLPQVSVWSKKDLERERKKGNSFIYCALRDGKELFSRGGLNTALPKTLRRAAKDRLGLVRRNIEGVEFSFGIYENHGEEFEPGFMEQEHLGFASMHLCWAVCMLNNFCPVSKHTVLKECRKYFTKEEIRSIKRAYRLYAKRSGEGMRKKTFMDLFKAMKSIIERIEGEYINKDSSRKPSGKRAAKHMNSGAAN